MSTSPAKTKGGYFARVAFTLASTSSEGQAGCCAAGNEA